MSQHGREVDNRPHLTRSVGRCDKGYIRNAHCARGFPTAPSEGGQTAVRVRTFRVRFRAVEAVNPRLSGCGRGEVQRHAGCVSTLVHCAIW